MAVWSCVPFFNELTLLDLRIAEELDVVDKLVIAEADRTHQGQPKPLHLKDNERYRLPKIELVLLEDSLEPGPWEDETSHRGAAVGPWRNEALQRDALQRKCEDDDVLIVSDLDEVNHREDIEGIVEQALAHGHVRLLQQLFYYKINLRVRMPETRQLGTWNRAFAVTGRHLRETGHSFSDLRNAGGELISTRGKHFSYLADPDGIAEKIQSFAHHELNEARFTDLAQIEARIRNRIDPFERGLELERVEIDETYPVTIRENLEAWQPYMA